MRDLSILPTDVFLPSVAIMLATHNGEEYLRDQLLSIARQKGALFQIIVSDDNSTDETVSCLKEFQSCNRSISVDILKGPCNGFAENFRHLIQSAPRGCDYYAFCDQDDVWMDDKTERSISALAALPKGIAGLYCCRTENTDAAGKPIGYSPEFRRPPTFENALVQSIAGGNTMMLNAAGFKMLQKCCEALPFVSHDWFAYQMISGGGGVVLYDRKPSVHYRQHDKNVIGKNTGLLAAFSRMLAMFRGRYRVWNEINLRILNANRSTLTEGAQRHLEQFELARDGSIFVRMAALWRAGVYRQTILGTVSLWVACFLKGV